MVNDFLILGTACGNIPTVLTGTTSVPGCLAEDLVGADETGPQSKISQRQHNNNGQLFTTVLFITRMPLNVLLALLLGTRTLLGALGARTLLGAPGLTTRNKKPLGCISTQYLET